MNKHVITVEYTVEGLFSEVELYHYITENLCHTDRCCMIGLALEKIEEAGMCNVLRGAAFKLVDIEEENE